MYMSYSAGKAASAIVGVRRLLVNRKQTFLHLPKTSSEYGVQFVTSTMTQSARQLPDPLVESIAGLSAGLASTLIAHPLDLIKTRLQGIRLGSQPYVQLLNSPYYRQLIEHIQRRLEVLSVLQETLPAMKASWEPTVVLV